MPWQSCSVGERFRLWFWDYGSLQEMAIFLIYIQIGCSMVGSVGALFNGILLVNMVVALFALVAIESGSQVLGRIYGVLLICVIFLDASWFVFFSGTIWNITYNENYGPLFVFSLRLALWMQVIGFTVRIFSSLLWFQMYRLGVSSGDNLSNHEAFYHRSSLNPSNEDLATRSFMSDSIIRRYVHVASRRYTPLFEDAQDKGYTSEGEIYSNCCNGDLLSGSEALQLTSFN